jgi:hypothetical protein
LGNRGEKQKGNDLGNPLDKWEESKKAKKAKSEEEIGVNL